MLTHWLQTTNILFGIVRICSSLYKCNYLKKETFSPFFLPFMESPSNFNIFGKKMIVIANVFLILQTVKDLIKALSKKCRFRTSFGSQQVKGSQTLVKSAWGIFYHILWSSCGKMTWKISPLRKFEIIGVFVNTLSSDDKYPVRDCENLQFLIQIQLSQKQETISKFFVPFLES